MSLTGFVDVAIGLVLMYLLLSLVCTTINEFIATVTKLRARNLSKTLAQLLDDENVRKAFYNHGLIANSVRASRSGKPAPGANADKSIRVPATTASGKPLDKDHPSYFDPRTVALALLDSLNKNDQRDPKSQTQFPTIESIRESVEKMDDSNIRDVLLASLSDAGKSIDRARDNLAAWFDSAMDRLSGGYKRKLKWISLGVGFAIAAALNADSIVVGQRLWSDQALRGQLVASANATVTAGLPTACPDGEPGDKITCLVDQLGKEEDALRPFPIGWTDLKWPPVDATSNYYLPQIGWLLLKILGLAWTGIALSLGAPFWFDILQKFMNLRGTGVKPSEKTVAAAAPSVVVNNPPATPAGSAPLPQQ